MSKIKYISQELQQTFERFLMGKMDANEAHSFTKDLKRNSELKAQFEDFKDMFLVVEEEVLKNKLNKFHKNLPTATQLKSKKAKKNYYLIAASVIIFLFLGGYWFLNKQPKNEKLYATYFTPDPGLLTVMGENDNYNFYEAMVDYKEANYKTAISKWKLLLKAKPSNDTLNYFIGVSYLNVDDTDEATAYLSKVTSLQTSAFLSDAYLYFGLIQLKKNEIESAKNSLIKSDSKTAKMLLKALE